jgi:hypothetical protein
MADLTLTTATGAVQASPTAQTKLSPVEGAPTTRKVVDVFTVAVATAATDRIRVRKVQGGSVILPTESDILEATTASELTLDVGIYEVAADGGIGTVVSKDVLADGVDFAGAGVYIERPYTVPTVKTEYWIVAEVISVTGTTVADETLDFITCINSAN